MSKLTSLPPEVLERIVTCASEDDDEEDTYEQIESEEEEFEGRSVHALSSVNRLLQQICLPVIWRVSLRLLAPMACRSIATCRTYISNMSPTTTSNISLTSLHRNMGISSKAVSRRVDFAFLFAPLDLDNQSHLRLVRFRYSVFRIQSREEAEF
jgi:hypothetical protein